MRVLMTGATGLLGREVGKRLAARGDTLVCLVRDVERARRSLPYPAACLAWDHARDVPAGALNDVDAVVHLAGEPVAGGRWTPERKRAIRDSRVLGTRRLVRAVLEQGQRVASFVHGSAIGFYGERGDEVLSAASARGSGFLADVTADWEAEAAALARARPQVRVPIVRTGIVLARDGGALAQMLPPFRASVGGRLGDGRQWMSWIHVDDIAALLVHALDAGATGPLEGVAPLPVTNRQFTSALCRALGTVEGLPVPAAALRALYGEMGEVLLQSARVEPRSTLAGGFRHGHSTIEAALDDLAVPLRGATWQKAWEVWVPHAPEALWPYFCDERNLEELTPPFLRFEVLGKSTPAIGEGTLIDYRLRLDGIPLRWRSRIEDWTPPQRFVDVQVRGPYAHWHHLHEFVPLAGGTLMRDVVRFRPPLGWLGATAAGWKVESYVDRIFDYRRQRIVARFGA